MAGMDAKSESVKFNGITFRRYPEAATRSEREYFTPGIADRNRGVGRLHVEVWRHANGGAPIPDGFHVHHVDLDPRNNAPGNLALMAAADHRALHAAERRNDPEWMLEARARAAHARDHADIWHGSDEGRAWHSEHGKRVWEDREQSSRICDLCGTEYQAFDGTGAKYCSGRCKARARRLSGTDDVERDCAMCSKKFTVNRYSKTRCCSRSCGARLGMQKQI